MDGMRRLTAARAEADGVYRLRALAQKQYEDDPMSPVKLRAFERVDELAQTAAVAAGDVPVRLLGPAVVETGVSA
jgi:hypothetical protein